MGKKPDSSFTSHFSLLLICIDRGTSIGDLRRKQAQRIQQEKVMKKAFGSFKKKWQSVQDIVTALGSRCRHLEKLRKEMDFDQQSELDDIHQQHNDAKAQLRPLIALLWKWIDQLKRARQVIYIYPRMIELPWDPSKEQPETTVTDPFRATGSRLPSILGGHDPGNVNPDMADFQSTDQTLSHVKYLSVSAQSPQSPPEVRSYDKEIDVVITHVDGSDKAWRAAFNARRREMGTAFDA